MEIRHLRYFVAVAELQNFTRAAERSFVAQSALSQQIGRLEREIGAPLFVRGARKVELTPAGELLLPHAHRIIADEAQARAELRSYLGLEKGRLRVGLIQTAISAVDVVGPIGAFHDRHPGVDIHITNQTSTEMVEAVRAGALDLAVVGMAPKEVPEGLEHRLLAVDPLVGVACEKVASGLVGPIALPELIARGRLIHFARGTGLRRHVDEALHRVGLEALSSFELAQASDILRFAALGLGVTVVPQTLAEYGRTMLPDLEIPYAVFGLRDPDAVHPVTVVYDPQRIPASGRAFLEILEEFVPHKRK
ncbi:LysR family transcriptional regulator [Nocardioides sp. DS6]|uniref:LysR family transcriptional regulator n=1 Tax=Nocardioides eburneus TaxID=3231482 RepID=A0ABV3T015_9ACTN